MLQALSAPSTLHALSAAPRLVSRRSALGPHEQLYRRLLQPRLDAQALDAAATYLDESLRAVAADPVDLPERPEQLHEWMEDGAHTVMQRYGEYMKEREHGAPRRFFFNRAHALYFLRMVAPTKLVDGSWLWGLTAQADNPRLAPLVRTYLEELGDGDPAKNHVLLYRRLLEGLGLDQERAAPDAAWQQGAIQLALGCQAERYLPEVVGFNLGYEQLPLHLLITAYELDELGIDPYYFTLHVTVDNGASGHARQACDAVLGLLPRYGDADAFWHRVREGAKLGCVGMGTTEAIDGFDARTEVVRILTDKAPLGAGAHANHCRLGGRSINDWLREPEGMDSFLQQLERAPGWLRLGEPPADSRFWQLLQGERAQMFGVFSPYELQVIHDWIRGDDSADGLPFTEAAATNQGTRRPRFRALQARAARAKASAAALPGLELDPDLADFKRAWARGDGASRSALMVEALGPASHWTPAGLHATRLFAARA
ncbi:MAG: iron-containing redox enzyme family protein [Burkholderiaceae bacterium]|nr:iron-containing redox enzyme family protein [Burkholderiaceae bacterium]